jgi:hypothetical protein
MWWVHLAAYLPEGRLCVGRSWGRNPAEAGLRFGGLEVSAHRDGWTSTVDTVGQLTSIDELSHRPRGDSAPSRPLSWEVRASAAAPMWDMYADRGGERLNLAGDTHVQQALRTTGTLRVGDDEYPLDGIGWSDHSSGPRRFEGWVSHRFMLLVGPEWTAHLLVMDAPDGSPTPPWGRFYRGDEVHEITRFDHPSVTDADGGPLHGPLVFSTSGGETFEFAAELVHTLPICITRDNDNFNGIDWDLADEPLVCFEGNIRLTAPDGTVVHGYHERSARRGALIVR